jgi:hypothetical protein
MLTLALASLRNVAAPTPGRFSMRTLSAGRSVNSMPAPSSAARAAASSSAMNGDRAGIAVRRPAQHEIDSLRSHRLAQTRQAARLVLQLYHEGAHFELVGCQKSVRAGDLGR